ncbi:MAG: zinc-binding dehydrogenase [Rhodococcus sp.]|nr:zinc-binding dehydrogenase [Rhodococcus sp. (in: high G+C Gram-positive bacteria)]
MLLAIGLLFSVSPAATGSAHTRDRRGVVTANPVTLCAVVVPSTRRVRCSHQATGACGSCHLAVRIAHRLGAHVVAIAGSGKHDWLRSLGAGDTVDYRDADAVAEYAGSVDVASSLAGSREDALRSVRPGGTLIALGGGVDELESAARDAEVRFAATYVRTEREWIEQVAALAARRALTPMVSEVFDLVNAAAAHRALEKGHGTGKIVLRT